MKTPDYSAVPRGALFFRDEGSECRLAAADTARNLRPFEMVVNSGEPILDHWYWGTFLFDLKGLKVNKKSIPVLRDHDTNQVVGYTEKTKVTEAGFTATGQIILSDEPGERVSNLSDANFPWQASFYFIPKKVETVEEGSSAKVNGKTYPGPARIIREAIVREVSFCPLGADERTEARAMSGGLGETVDLSGCLAGGQEAAAEGNEAEPGSSTEPAEPGSSGAEVAVELRVDLSDQLRLSLSN